MIKRWCVYLSVLALCIGIYVAMPVWAAWIAVLTAAGSPLVSVALSIIMPKRGGEYDCLGLFRFSAGKAQGPRYVQQLRPYHPGDSLGRVHWKLTAKTGKITVWEERPQQIDSTAKPTVRRIWAAVPVGICLLLLMLAFPRSRYGHRMRMLQELFLSSGDTTVQLDLTAGPRQENRQAVLDVVASQAQLLYLREQSFEIYDGHSWQTADRSEQWQPQGAMGRVSIATRQGQEYTFLQPPGAEAPENCLQLPQDTRLWAEGILAQSGMAVEQIRSFVRSCASYDANAAVMPDGADFARWFLEESGSGYCVHFATLATVLLRAAGTPARLATGYAVTVQASVRKTVTGQDAHAWAEYWDGNAWQILEATPTMEAVPPAETPALLPKEEKESRLLSGWWVLILVALAVQELGLRKFGKLPENPRLTELRQKAAFSRNGLTEAEINELYLLATEEKLSLSKGALVYTFPFTRNTRKEREGKKMKQEEKKPIPWEVADPKPPVVQSGKMENRKQN